LLDEGEMNSKRARQELGLSLQITAAVGIWHLFCREDVERLRSSLEQQTESLQIYR